MMFPVDGNFEVGESSGGSISVLERPLPTHGDSGDCDCVCCYCNSEFGGLRGLLEVQLGEILFTVSVVSMMLLCCLYR